jgi:hypothetical protein
MPMIRSARADIDTNGLGGGRVQAEAELRRSRPQVELINPNGYESDESGQSEDED